MPVIRSAGVALLLVGAAGSAAWADPSTPAPVGAVVLPAAPSAERFDTVTVLGTSPDAMVLERRPPNDWRGNPFPATYEAVMPQGARHALPNLDPGYRVGFVDGDVLTTWSDNPVSEVRRRSVSTGQVLPGDSSPVAPEAGLVAASAAGWVTSASTIDGVHMVFTRPDGTSVDLSPPAGLERRIVGAGGDGVYFFDSVSPDEGATLKRLDAATGTVSVLTTSGPNVGRALLTPHLVVWTQRVWNVDAQRTDASLCRAERTDGATTCRPTPEDRYFSLAAATDTSVAWRTTFPAEVSVSSLSGDFSVRPVSGVAVSELADGDVRVLGDHFVARGTRGRIWQFGSEARAQVLDQSPARPAEALGLALAPGRLVGADNRRVLDEGVYPDDDYDNVYAGWTRPVTQGEVPRSVPSSRRRTTSTAAAGGAPSPYRAAGPSGSTARSPPRWSPAP
ncbi:hypothetical protein [Intrasporangium flavum]|uniref:hypothetical protein n=1 Tax=Intrasporangium flavum TaxID=1428657 RepID=UPI00096C329F|nr:hypothetical protein [Intrasporangium flavum]